MYLIFSESMIIPEMADRREDAHFEDRLTAALIEDANQRDVDDDKSSPRGITDLWMLEITDRTGKIWSGSFQVEFSKEDAGAPRNANMLLDRSGVLSFLLETDTGEMTFGSETRERRSARENGRERSGMLVAAA